MKQASLTTIILTASALAIGLSVAGYSAFARHAPTNYSPTDRLEQVAKERFENGRGLSPCMPEMRDSLKSARSRLQHLGEGDPELLAAVLPTFSGAVLVAFSPKGISSFRFKGQTGFLPPNEVFSSAPERISTLQPSA